MKPNHFLYYLLLIIYPVGLLSQPKSYIEHYGAEDGLPQHTVMDMLQDQKGFMWFSTWDGLCKFDGYHFKAFKIDQSNTYHMRSNRMDKILEDKNGYIWTLSYDREVHRFDPHTESFMGLKSLNKDEQEPFFASDVILAPSGQVWLISDDKGAICVLDKNFKIESFNVENSKLRNNKINSVYEDKDQNSWILTDDGLYAFTKEHKTMTSFPLKKNASLLNPFFAALEVNNEIWFGSADGKIEMYNKKSRNFRTFDIKKNSSITGLKRLDDNQILITTKSTSFFIHDIRQGITKEYSIQKNASSTQDEILNSYVDKQQNIWFEQNKLGISRFDTKSESVTHFTINAESPIVNVTAPKFFIIEDRMGNIWVHPRGGGFSFYDPKSNKLVPFHNDPESSAWKFSSMLHAVYLDKQGNLWLSTHTNGLEKVIFSEDIFKPITVDDNRLSPMDNVTRCIFEDKDQQLWVSTKNGRIHVYDSSFKRLGYLCSDGTIGHKTPIEGITYCMMQDDKERIWIGTKGEGIYRLEKKGQSNSFHIINYRNQNTAPYSLSSNNVYAIFQDAKKRIWIGTYGGGLNLFMEDERFINYKNQLSSYPSTFGSQVRVIASDVYGNICVGTTLGMIMFSGDFSSPQNIDYKFYTRKSGDETSLTGNDIYDIVTTTRGETFLANFGGGINKIEEVDKKGFPTKFKSFTTKDGLSSNISLLIAEDHDGKLWITTEGNISKFNPENNEFKTYSEIYRLTSGNTFSEGTKCVSSRGIVYIGYSQGFLAINPHIIKDNTFKPYVALTKFQIANKDVQVGEDSPLKKTIDDLEVLTLSNTQNFFNIEFAAIDHVETKQIMYAYKLDGFDKDWIITQDQRIATYNNLSPGEYTFRVKSTNSDGIWMDNEHALLIDIVPSFWQTNWAKLLYFLVSIGLISLIFRSIFVFYRMRDKMTLEQEQIEMKTRFFMDISHEIRTPLTMVVSPIENILEEDMSPAETKNQLQLVLKNANRMLNMVNHILDFRKIQKVKLNIEEIDVVNIVEDICLNFSKTADMEGISLRINNSLNGEKLWADRDWIEKLVFNLLSNAFKFISEGKNISVNLDKKGNQLAIEVEDEGRGMTKDIMSKLFTRFTSFSQDKSKPSTGIGLSIVKEIAEKHKAKIEVQSEENQGSKFTILFPLGFEHFNEDDVEFVSAQVTKTDTPIVEKTAVVSQPDDVEIEDSDDVAEIPTDRKETILIVEDDNDLRKFIVKMLENYYDVLEAENGKVGYDIASTQLPDFIISDIMMPEVDGLEFLQNIRNNNETSHIPFILLSAKADIESRLEGLKYGADDYITKPFSVKYLKARIGNIIARRKNIYESYLYNAGSVVGSESPQLLKIEEQKHPRTITPQDENFIKKAKEIIEKNIDNSDFVVDDLVSEMAMSRTVFFKKMKSLIGMAPIEFIREVKIKYAAQVIVRENYTIKEISFMIGISDTKYFTKWFKKIIGTTPMEYREMHRKK